MKHLPLAPDIFQKRLIDWQRQHGRHDLPWQEKPTPYRVLVSEIMLQQTQVATVIPYFERWMTSFPTIAELAVSAEDTVMNHWQGLGYYSRARNLRKAALYIMGECNGDFPILVEDLIKIPGVGRYTAGAIASFAYDSYGPIVDGNVKRLFCRFFGIEGVPGTSQVDKQLWRTAAEFTPQQDNRNFAQGLLDMGATICRPKNPKCQECAFQDCCIALLTGSVASLPTPKPKKVIPTKSGEFLWIEQDGKILLEKRPENGIWGALWCLPQIDRVQDDVANNIKEEQPIYTAELKGIFKHTFTHYKLNANVWSVKSSAATTNQQRWVVLGELKDLGLPTPIKKFVLSHL